MPFARTAGKNTDMNAKPDMQKVKAALELYGRPKPAARDWRSYPPKPSPVAQDAPLRKPLKSHGIPCTTGFMHHHFLNRD